MAPRKEKSEKASADQANDMILQYLRKQKLVLFLDPNLDVSANLHNKVTKAHAAKVLKEMHERNEIAGKAAGGYTPNQEEELKAINLPHHSSTYNREFIPPPQAVVPRAPSWGMRDSLLDAEEPTRNFDPQDAASPEELAAMDIEIERIKEEICAAKVDEKALKATLATMKGTLSTQDLHEAVQALELEKKQLEYRLDTCRSGSVKTICAEEKSTVDNELKKWQKYESARRKTFRALWDQVSEAIPEGTTTTDFEARSHYISKLINASSEEQTRDEIQQATIPLHRTAWPRG
ncbi:MAG: hypothetical protein M1827_001698 [Pycnora praestabilis]|nr:MAG: hypothetical protein M1827_001698 [Pycnora praestabilis]